MLISHKKQQKLENAFRGETMREQIGWLAFFGAATLAIGLWLKGVNIILALTVGFIGSFVAAAVAIVVVFGKEKIE